MGSSQLSSAQLSAKVRSHCAVSGSSTQCDCKWCSCIMKQVTFLPRKEAPREDPNAAMQCRRQAAAYENFVELLHSLAFVGVAVARVHNGRLQGNDCDVNSAALPSVSSSAACL